MLAPRESVADYHTEIFVALNVLNAVTIELNLKQLQRFQHREWTSIHFVIAALVRH